VKVGVYSGDIPSNTFIERLIHGLSEQSGLSIYLFGRRKSSIPAYRDNVSIKSFKRTSDQALLGLYYRILFMFKPTQWHAFSKAWAPGIISHKERLKRWGKVLPVVYERLDIFHVQWAKNLPDWIFLEQLNVRVICSLRGAHINYSPLADASLARAYRESFSKCSGFHAVSKAILTEAIHYGDISSRSRVVYSGLNLSDFPFTNKLKSSGHFKIVSVGRAHWKKGYHYALDALKLLADANFSFSYTIIGGLAEELQYQVYDLGLESRVSFEPNLPLNKVKEAMIKHDILLLPSVEEGIANVVLESMALGTPVISTNCGGMAEVIEEGKNGFLVPVRDARAMAEKIKNVSQMDSEALKTICTTARKMIEKQHPSIHMIEGMVDLYKVSLS
jgi:glycosyltransferase involved in cell wall biosynthesis